GGACLILAVASVWLFASRAAGAPPPQLYDSFGPGGGIYSVNLDGTGPRRLVVPGVVAFNSLAPLYTDSSHIYWAGSGGTGGGIGAAGLDGSNARTAVDISASGLFVSG